MPEVHPAARPERSTADATVTGTGAGSAHSREPALATLVDLPRRHSAVLALLALPPLPEPDERPGDTAGPADADGASTPSEGGTGPGDGGGAAGPAESVAGSGEEAGPARSAPGPEPLPELSTSAAEPPASGRELATSGSAAPGPESGTAGSMAAGSVESGAMSAQESTGPAERAGAESDPGAAVAAASGAAGEPAPEPAGPADPGPSGVAAALFTAVTPAVAIAPPPSGDTGGDPPALPGAERPDRVIPRELLPRRRRTVRPPEDRPEEREAGRVQVLDRSWSQDEHTLRRLLVGLKAL